ncbi:MAG: folate-binding protein YgfZ [Legionella sp.]|nr:folate-binding protein YgfZ [Legionella sp.]
MKTPNTYLINKRPLTAFNAVDKELELNPEINYLFDLSHFGVLDVQGANALEFLQGQLTCDVQSVSDIQIVQGAQCNLKGRILALMDVLLWNGAKLVLPQDLLEATINSLNKTAMLSRVALTINHDVKVFGFYLQNKQEAVPGVSFFPDSLYALSYGTNYCCYHLGKGFYILLAETTLAEELFKNFEAKNQLLGSLTWHTLRLAQQQLDIYPESRGLFLPHRLDLHETAYLSFNKGCYKGQEIIARMHYKATIKHELKIYTVSTDETIYSGQKLLKEQGGAELGELVDFSMLGNNRYVVAVSILKGIEPSVWFDGHSQLVQFQID